MTRTLYTVILAVFAYGCATGITASEREVSAREDARETALWQLLTTDKK
jgi:hypothetical protein